jgi:hypothetical protein
VPIDAVLRCQLAGLNKGVAEFVRVEDANRLAPQALGHLDVVHAIALGAFDQILGCVDVVEGELNVVVHLEAAL